MDNIVFIAGSREPPGNKSLDELERMWREDIQPKGFHFLQKFTCEQCGERLTMDVLDILYFEGDCEQCGHTTDIRKTGGGMVMITDPSLMVEKGILRWPDRSEFIE